MYKQHRTPHIYLLKQKHNQTPTQSSTSSNNSVIDPTTTTSTTTSMVVKEGSCKKRTKLLCQYCTLYSCSSDRLLDRAEYQYNLIDVAFGHQFLHGNKSLSALLSHRIVRSFTILRHPFVPKLSLFFHFLVRQARIERARQNCRRYHLLFAARGRQDGR